MYDKKRMNWVHQSSGENAKIGTLEADYYKVGPEPILINGVISPS